jgi:hypothetical protein
VEECRNVCCSVNNMYYLVHCYVDKFYGWFDSLFNICNLITWKYGANVMHQIFVVMVIFE